MNPIRFFLVLSLLASFVTSCSFYESPPVDAFSGWTRSHVVWLGSGESIQPSGPLIAAYYRETSQESQIRLDLIEMPDFYNFKVSLVIDFLAGGKRNLPDGTPTSIAWELLLDCSSENPPSATSAYGAQSTAISPRLFIDSQLDIIVVAWNRHIMDAPQANLRFQAFLFESGGSLKAFFTPELWAGSSVLTSSPLLLVFWNALPASTPSQALRRWDGAHTGPLGQRHGLNVLLTRANEHNIPLTLLDLYTPGSMNALEYMQVSDTLKKSTVSGMINIPSILRGSSSDELSFEKSLLTKLLSQSGWPPSSIAYGPFGFPFPGGFTHLFAKMPSTHQIVNYEGINLIPLPENFPQIEQAADFTFSDSDLSLLIKKQLLEVALTSDPSDLVVIGGNLPASLWAENTIARKVFKYIAYHPWINPLSAQELTRFTSTPVHNWPVPDCQDLLCLPPVEDFKLLTSDGNTQPSGLSFRQLKEVFGEQLEVLPDNAYTQAAKNVFLYLTDPFNKPLASRLRASFLNQIGYLIFASQWAESPESFQSCDLDVDWDGLPECVLADEHVVTIVELDGGRIVLAGSPTIQWIGPSSQLSVGTGDPSSWDFNLGSAADPDVIPGAFGELSTPYAYHNPQILAGSVILSSQDSCYQKEIHLADGTLSVEITGCAPYRTNIPLIHQNFFINPAQSTGFDPVTCDGDVCHITWLDSNLQITIMNASIHFQSYLDSKYLMTSPEDPDRSYPAGHYLPFGLSVISLDNPDMVLNTPVRVFFK